MRFERMFMFANMCGSLIDQVVCISMYVSVRLYVCMYVCMNVYMYVCLSVCMHIYMHV